MLVDGGKVASVLLSYHGACILYTPEKWRTNWQERSFSKLKANCEYLIDVRGFEPWSIRTVPRQALEYAPKIEPCEDSNLGRPLYFLDFII